MNLRRKIRETMRPDIFHGQQAKPPFFEGWYFKLANAAETRAWAVIPGIYRDTQAHPDQAFVMVVDGAGHDVAFHRYPVSGFRAADKHFYVQVGPNMYAADFLTFNLPGMSGQLRFIEKQRGPLAGARRALWAGMPGFQIVVNNGKETLRITAVQGATALLHAPTPREGMVPRVQERVAATVAVQLRDRTGTVLFESESRFGRSWPAAQVVQS